MMLPTRLLIKLLTTTRLVVLSKIASLTAIDGVLDDDFDDVINGAFEDAADNSEHTEHPSLFLLMRLMVLQARH
jgi:hypothetical protein